MCRFITCCIDYNKSIYYINIKTMKTHLSSFSNSTDFKNQISRELNLQPKDES